MVEVIEIHQLEENTQSVDKNLSQMGTKVDAAPIKPNKPGKGDKNPKGDKESQPNKPSKPDKPNKPSKPNKPDKGAAEVDAAAAKGKGKKGEKGKGDKGKGDKGQSPSPRLSPEEKKQRPCMYYAYNSCSKGASCPYLHDDGNKYSGPKPKGLAKKDEPSSSAGAAQVIAGAAFASSIKGAKAQTSSEDSAIKGAVRDAKKWCVRFAKDQKKFSKGSVFEKALKAIAALIACCNPLSVEQENSIFGMLSNQVPGMIGSITSSNETLDNPCVSHEFLLDTGAGRNLISNKGLPNDFKPFVGDAPEKVNFATGGGKRVSSKAIKLKGSLSGTNVFYTLKDCPAALSVGLQVNEHQRPFIWLPDQLPFLVKADRVQDMTFHCPESAKIYADRVVENVPILAETVSGLDMNSNIPFAPASSSSSSGPSSSSARGPSDLPRDEEPLRLKDPAVPCFGSGGDELDKVVEPVKEKGDEALDSEDEELNPWTPSLRVNFRMKPRA